MRGDEQEAEEWVRRIDEAEAGHASAADIERLYYALKSCPETGRGGAWCSVASGYARIAALPYAPVSVLRALTYDALHVTSNKTYARTAGQVVNKLGDNVALPRDMYAALEQEFGGNSGVCPEMGVRNPRRANEVARRVIFGNPASGDAPFGPWRTLQAVRDGVVSGRDVLAYLGARREWTVMDATNGDSDTYVWSWNDAFKLESGMCKL